MQAHADLHRNEHDGTAASHWDQGCGPAAGHGKTSVSINIGATKRGPLKGSLKGFDKGHYKGSFKGLWYGFRIGTSTITYAILGVSVHSYSIIYPKTLFSLLKPIEYGCQTGSAGAAARLESAPETLNP